jgi:hypothetical protein
MGALWMTLSGNLIRWDRVIGPYLGKGKLMPTLSLPQGVLSGLITASSLWMISRSLLGGVGGRMMRDH